MRAWIWSSLLFLSLALAGCSVGMALSGDSQTKIEAVKIGETREAVELELGNPISSVPNADGTQVVTYVCKTGNKRSFSRAAGHAVMDVLTFGLWEVVGTPVELGLGERQENRIEVVYGANDCVTAFELNPTATKDNDAAQSTLD